MHVRPVQLTILPAGQPDGLIEVRSPNPDQTPLQPGDRVAVDPVLGLSEGDKLEVPPSPVETPRPAPAARPATDGGSHD